MDALQAPAPLGEGIADRRVTVVTSMTVDPSSQDALVALIQRGHEETVRLLPGFLSSTVLRSLDGHRVMVASDWVSAEAFEAAARSLAMVPLFQDIAALARSDMHLYELVGAHLADETAQP